jgi:hypothetical protein
MRYSVATTSIHQLDTEKIQQQATSAFLAKIGYNRNMPRKVVFGHQLHQGLGFRHLFDMQGIDGIIALIQELNSIGTTNEILMATIQTVQLESGMSKSIFEDTTPLTHISWSRLMSIRDFLHHMNAEICGIPVTIIPHYKENDTHIMEAIMHGHNNFMTKELTHIQACRLHMQVTVLSELTDATGEQIRDNWLYPNKQRSDSRWQWP